jgi:Fe-S-cluster containining protein
MNDNPFNRTVCACKDCVACCKRQPGSLIAGDFERIVDWFMKTQNWSREIALSHVKKQLWASPGAMVKNALTGEVRRVGTITPRWDRRRKCCVFLDENDRCTIHEVAPFGCAYVDTHMNRATAHERSLYGVTNQEQPDYQALRNQLPYATHHKPFHY